MNDEGIGRHVRTMQVRRSRSLRTRAPARGGANAVSFIVCASLALAVAMAFAAMRFAPEQPMREPSMKVAQQIDFDVLERGASIAALERGRSYYVQLCVPCHGASGRGDGEWAYRMTPRPTDLTGRRTSGRSEEALRAAISDGIPGTAMRGWDDRLSGTQIRQVLGYVRHLGRVESARAESP
jgi:mono/diheme cytochrome c family protein